MRKAAAVAIASKLLSASLDGTVRFESKRLHRDNGSRKWGRVIKPLYNRRSRETRRSVAIALVNRVHGRFAAPLPFSGRWPTIVVFTSISLTRIVNYPKDKCGINTVWDRKRLFAPRTVSASPFMNFRELGIPIKSEYRKVDNVNDVLIKERKENIDLIF